MKKNQKLILNKKSQAFSVDIVIVMLVVLFGVLILVMSQIGEIEKEPTLAERYETVSIEAQQIFDHLKENDIVKDSDDSVDVQELMLINEEEIRNELGISGKFCIVFSKNGDLVKIDSESSVNGVGSGDIKVRGEPCLSQ